MGVLVETMKKLLLATALALAPVAAFADPDVPSTPVRIDPAPLQYMQSCMPGPAYSMKFSAANRAKLLQDPSVAAAAAPSWAPVRLGWGTQWKIACDANGAVLACLHQTTSTTVSLGLASTGGDGAGFIGSDGSNSGTGPGRCIALTAVTPTDFIKISPASFKCNRAASSRDPTTRCGRCSVAGTGHQVGDPCGTSTDCGSGGTCDANSRPAGVYLSLVPVSASSVCWISRCDQ